MKRWILMIGFVFGLMAMASAQQVEVDAKVQDESVAVGKPFSLDLMMKVPYGYYVEWNEFATDTLSAQIDILKRGDLLRTADADSNIIVQQQLTLMTFDTGYVQVPSVGLVYAKSADNGMRMKAYTDPLQLYVTTITVDTTQVFRPIVEPIAQPLSMKDLFPWILGVLLLVLLGFGVWFFLKRRKSRLDENGEPIKGPVIPPYNKAIGDLESLKQQKLWQVGKVKEYYSSLTDIAREYIEGQFKVNAVEMTTDTILEEVKELHFDEVLYGKLKDTMELADLVKFAKCSTSPLENDNAMSDMTDFVNDSYAHYQAMKAKEEEEARQHV
ncbi:MAG: hypothetical protein IKT08_05815 [Bacteroidales bacterium]|nr:hypothetical protein [Bacteroidales bacterium]